MVDEYLSEREQAEQLRVWLRQNGIWLLAGVALTVGGYYGYRWWESRGAQRSIEAGERFAAMLDAIGGGKRDEGLKIAGEVTGEYADTPYADQANLVLARLDVDTGNLAGAEARLATIAAESKDPDLRIVARLRLARVQLAAGPLRRGPEEPRCGRDACHRPARARTQGRRQARPGRQGSRARPLAQGAGGRQG